MLNLAHPTHRRGVIAAMFLTAFAVVLPASAQDLYRGVVSVEVFANSAMPIEAPASPPFKVTVYRMDGLAMVEQMINQNLPKSEPEAIAYLNANMARIKKQVEPQAMNAANGMRLAMFYKIDRLPAIVINGQSLILGVTNVASALSQYQSHQASKNSGAARTQ